MFYKEIPYQLACVDQKCSIDLYIKIKNEYRLFAAKGAELHDEQYLMLGKEKVYIQSADLAAAEQDMNAHIMNVLTDPNVTPEIKADIAYTISMRSIQDVFQGTNSKTISELKKMTKNIIRMILADSRVMDDLVDVTSSDHYTLKHSVKVGIYGTALSIKLFEGTSEDHNIEELSTAFFLHDIGMTKVPTMILDKEEPLTEGDWDTIKSHPIWGHDKLKKADYLNDEVASVVLYHHERCNGTGYPFKKSGSDIPLYARICAVVDTFESLTSGRPFRLSVSPFEALRVMHVQMANEFDDRMFKTFIMLLGSGR